MAIVLRRRVQAREVNDTDVVVMMARTGRQRKPRMIQWPQTDAFVEEGHACKLAEAWVVRCPSVRAAQEQAARWPNLIAGCKVIRRFRDGRWLESAKEGH